MCRPGDETSTLGTTHDGFVPVAVGGFKFTAQSSDKVRSRLELSNQENAPKKDLAERVGEAVKRGIEKRFPGAKLPVTFGI